MNGTSENRQRVTRIHTMIDRLCGLYSRVAQRVGVTRSFVSRVARGERRSEEVERTIVQEFEQVNAPSAADTPPPGVS